MRISDWSSDVCSSDLRPCRTFQAAHRGVAVEADDEAVAGGARLLQQGHVAGVQKVETAVGEADLEPGLTPAGDLSHQAVEVGHLGFGGEQFQIGRASCRERVCQYV